MVVALSVPEVTPDFSMRRFCAASGVKFHLPGPRLTPAVMRQKPLAPIGASAASLDYGVDCRMPGRPALRLILQLPASD